MNRHEATRCVMKTMAMQAAGGLPILLDDGSRPLVVTTPSEYLSDVVKRIEAVGGSASVALAETKQFVVFTIERTGTNAGDDQSEPSDPLNDDMSMGMFHLRYSQAKKQGRSFHLKGSGLTVSLEANEVQYA